MRPAPVLLERDNFTPLARTPWAGDRITQTFKPELGTQRVGESWELSAGPEFPSKLVDGRWLSALLEKNPHWLGAHQARDGGLALLVKLLDAAQPLSVQIHPRDGDPMLADDESGKPESWYITHADEGAGIFLGFRDGVGVEDARSAAAGDGFSELMNFVPCKAGDFFLIPACTAHAIGPGLTLVEPQRVLPGRRGLTYRYWDWNRRYDESGRADDSGTGRPLHLERALACTDWSQGAKALRMFHRAGPSPSGPASMEHLCGDGACLPSDVLDVRRLGGTGRLELAADSLRALTVLEGHIEVDEVRADAGSTLALPTGRWSARLQGAHAILSALV